MKQQKQNINQFRNLQYSSLYFREFCNGTIRYKFIFRNAISGYKRHNHTTVTFLATNFISKFKSTCCLRCPYCLPPFKSSRAELLRPKKKPSGFFPIVYSCSRQYSPSAGREIAFYGGLVGVKYAPSTECVFACFGGGEGTCTPVPPYGQMPFYACSLRIGFPPKQVRKQTSRRGNAL